MLDWFKTKGLSHSVDEIDELTQTINEQGSEAAEGNGCFF